MLKTSFVLVAGDILSQFDIPKNNLVPTAIAPSIIEEKVFDDISCAEGVPAEFKESSELRRVNKNFSFDLIYDKQLYEFSTVFSFQRIPSPETIISSGAIPLVVKKEDKLGNKVGSFRLQAQPTDENDYTYSLSFILDKDAQGKNYHLVRGSFEVDKLYCDTYQITLTSLFGSKAGEVLPPFSYFVEPEMLPYFNLNNELVIQSKNKSDDACLLVPGQDVSVIVNNTAGTQVFGSTATVDDNNNATFRTYNLKPDLIYGYIIKYRTGTYWLGAKTEKN
jgi:hypothetical protein